ncbi:MAG: hypothetical protein QOH17_4196 [Pseudonocardiales bacterium]|nr:hypothetical protein [Pseudonocardiales bacterium]
MTVSKVIAGAGAAATSAVAGSIFGADGTVVGAAVGSVVSAVTAAAYERSLDRTRTVVVSKVRLPGGQTAEVTQIIPPDAAATRVLDPDATQEIPVQRRAAGIRSTTEVAPVPPARRTRLPLLIGATALIFLVGLLAVTGVELLAGGPVLSSQQGTSVGRVLGYSPPSADPTSTVDPTAAATTSSSEATDSSAEPTTAGKANPAAPASGSAADGSTPRTTSARVKETVAPTSAAAPGRN